MAVLDELEVLIENAETHEQYHEWDDEHTADSSTVRRIGSVVSFQDASGWPPLNSDSMACPGRALTERTGSASICQERHLSTLLSALAKALIGWYVVQEPEIPLCNTIESS